MRFTPRRLLGIGLLALLPADLVNACQSSCAPPPDVDCSIVVQIPSQLSPNIGTWWPRSLTGNTEAAWRLKCEFTPGPAFKDDGTPFGTTKGPVVVIHLHWPCGHVVAGGLFLPRCSYFTNQPAFSEPGYYNIASVTPVWHWI